MFRIPQPAFVREWGTTAADRVSFPDDDQLPDPDDLLHRAITIGAGPELTWRWLCQLRVAPYSYDWLDNLGRRSPRHLIPGLDALEVGQRAMAIFRVSGFERGRHVTYSVDCHPRLGRVVVTYLVDPVDGTGCRLLVRLRVRYPRAFPASVLMPVLLPAGDWVMMRKQLLTLKALAESDAIEASSLT